MSKTIILPLGGGGADTSNFYTKQEVNNLIANFIDNTVNDLVNYYTKTETYTQAEVNSLIGSIEHFQVVSTLPVTDIKTNVIYLLGPTGTGADQYEEYIYSNNNWVKIGETSIDLSGYVTSAEIEADKKNYFWVENITNSDNVMTITHNESTGDMYVSTDKIEWTLLGHFDSSSQPCTYTIPANGRVYLKGNLNDWGYMGGPGISLTGNYKVGGKIVSIVNNDPDVYYPSNRVILQKVFFNETNLIDSSELVLALENSKYGQIRYNYLFEGCSNMTKTIDKIECNGGDNNNNIRLNEMYRCCSSLVKAPELKIKNVTANHMTDMFYGCSLIDELHTTFSTITDSYGAFNQFLDNTAATGKWYNEGGLDNSQFRTYIIPSGWVEITDFTYPEKTKLAGIDYITMDITYTDSTTQSINVLVYNNI